MELDLNGPVDDNIIFEEIMSAGLDNLGGSKVMDGEGAEGRGKWCC